LDAFYTLAPVTRGNKHNGRYTLQCDGTEVATVLVIVNSADNVLEVWSLEVYPDFRRLGHGRAMMNSIESFAHHLRLSGVWLKCNKDNHPALQMYNRAGYRVSRETSWDVSLVKEV